MPWLAINESRLLCCEFWDFTGLPITRCCLSHQLLLFIVLSFVYGSACQAAKDISRLEPKEERQILRHIQDIPDLIRTGKLLPEQVPNPHWRDDACYTCHKGKAGGKKVKLRDKSVNKLCANCHDPIFNHSYIHPVDVKPDAAMIARMPEAYRDSIEHSDGTLSCVTCHDLPAQCLKKRRNEKRQNTLFLRDQPYKTRTQQCYYCHDPEQYQKLNPHEQISDTGLLRSGTCELCHSEKLDVLKTLRGIENLDFYVNGDLSSMCTGCHPRKPHPGGGATFFRRKKNKGDPNHLVKPKAAMLKRMQKWIKASGAALPLEPDSGKVICATCHNPHEQGVVKNAVASNEKGIKHRLRTSKICTKCHEK